MSIPGNPVRRLDGKTIDTALERFEELDKHDGQFAEPVASVLQEVCLASDYDCTAAEVYRVAMIAIRSLRTDWRDAAHRQARSDAAGVLGGTDDHDEKEQWLDEALSVYRATYLDTLHGIRRLSNSEIRRLVS
jgi:hypothetical protein